jgi:hypothetical protein
MKRRVLVADTLWLLLWFALLWFVTALGESGPA